MKIDGPLWFIAALLICGAHVLYLRSWRRERLQHLAWWKSYDAKAQRRHVHFMSVIERDDVDACEWNLDGSRERGQA